MAMGVYLGAGSVKELKSCYVGAGGVKTVNAIYVGAGSVKKVWPAYTDYGGDDVTLDSSLDICQATNGAYGYLITTATSSSYHYRGTLWNYTNSANGVKNNTAINIFQGGTFSSSGNIHWYSVGPMDTRGYNYIRIAFCCGCYSTSETVVPYYGIPIFGYNSTTSNNPYYGGHYVTGSNVSFGNARSSSGYDTDYLYFLFDFTNINLESTYLQLGLQIGFSGSPDAAYNCIDAKDITMHKSKPSGSVSQTVTF